jgi:TolB-like protein
MKNACKWIALLILLIGTVQPVWAKGKSVVAVLPFAVHSGENIDYIRQGIGDMLASRISVSDRIEMVGRESLLAALKEIGGREPVLSDIHALGEKLKADFVVWGSITKIGSSLSIDGRLHDVAASKTALTAIAQCESMDEVIPKINDFAQKIENHITGGTPSAALASPTSKEIIVSRRAAPAQTAREAEIISGVKGARKGTFTSTINPDFINAEQPLNRETFWKSKQFPHEFRGMDIGDVNGDGLNETVIIDPNKVLIYQRKGDDFTLIQQIPGKSFENYIGVDVADINRNGVKEIIVSCLAGDQVSSFVIEFRDGKFVTIASGLPWFFRVIDNASGTPILMGQRRGMVKTFDTPIHEMVWRNGTYQEGQRMKIPQGLSVYGLTMEKLGAGGTERIIALNDWDYLCIFEQTEKPLSKVAIIGGSDEFIWKSEDVFGGSNTYIEPMRRGGTDKAADESDKNFINLRILTYDTNQDGKREVIIVKNASSAARFFERIKLFSSAEVYNLEWDGMGVVENWRTKKINGYVADYQFKDIDNDGENEIVLALVLSVGGTIRDRSVVVAYKMKGQ